MTWHDRPTGGTTRPMPAMRTVCWPGRLFTLIDSVYIDVHDSAAPPLGRCCMKRSSFSISASLGVGLASFSITGAIRAQEDSGDGISGARALVHRAPGVPRERDSKPGGDTNKRGGGLPMSQAQIGGAG